MSTIVLPILVAEDDESDRFILQLAFERAGIRNPLMLVCDGQEAVEYLAGRGRFADHSTYPLPALILLDLKMPRMSGFDVLDWMAVRDEFQDVPAVVLSSSSHESDLRKALALGARDYFVKPHTLSDLVGIVGQIGARWLPATSSHTDGGG